MKHRQQQYVGYWQATTTSPLTSLGPGSRWGPIINWLTYQASITRYQIMSSPLLTHFQDTISMQPRNDKCISILKQEIVTHLANPLRQLRKDCRSCRSSSCALMLACHSGLQFTQFTCHELLSPSNITCTWTEYVFPPMVTKTLQELAYWSASKFSQHLPQSESFMEGLREPMWLCMLQNPIERSLVRISTFWV